MSNILSNIENLPFYDYVVDKWNDYAGEHFQTKNPYVEELPDGKTRKLRLPNYCSKQDQKTFKKIQKRAWLDDRCFMGCYPIDCGLGLAPLVSLIPAIGPILMYAVHSRLIHMADREYHLGTKVVAKLELNILFDLLITLPPILGSFLSYLNGCSTRNAAIVYNTVSKRAYEAHQNVAHGDSQQQHQQQHTGPTYHEQRAPQVPPNRAAKFMDHFDYLKLNESQRQKQNQKQTTGVYH